MLALMFALVRDTGTDTAPPRCFFKARLTRNSVSYEMKRLFIININHAFSQLSYDYIFTTLHTKGKIPLTLSCGSKRDKSTSFLWRKDLIIWPPFGGCRVLTFGSYMNVVYPGFLRPVYGTIRPGFYICQQLV